MHPASTSPLTLRALLALFTFAACDHAAPPPVESPPAVPASAAPEAPRGKRSACTTDQSCNRDPSVSALWGKCNVDTGVCTCSAGFELHAGGYCQPANQ